MLSTGLGILFQQMLAFLHTGPKWLYCIANSIWLELSIPWGFRVTNIEDRRSCISPVVLDRQNTVTFGKQRAKGATSRCFYSFIFKKEDTKETFVSSKARDGKICTFQIPLSILWLLRHLLLPSIHWPLCV